MTTNAPDLWTMYWHIYWHEKAPSIETGPLWPGQLDLIMMDFLHNNITWQRKYQALMTMAGTLIFKVNEQVRCEIHFETHEQNKALTWMYYELDDCDSDRSLATGKMLFRFKRDLWWNFNMFLQWKEDMQPLFDEYPLKDY